MRTPFLLLGLLVALSACSDEGGEDILDPAGSSELDADVAPITQGSWRRLPLQTTWQWQLQGTINTSYGAEVYDIDLFETPAAVITGLHARNIVVLCYFSAGSAERRAPDYNRFPSGSLGRQLDGYPNERWLDIRRRAVMDIMTARLDLAVQRGCDGVEPDNVTAYDNDTDFPIVARDQLAFNRNLANEAHRRGLFIALKNDGDQAAELVDYFDLELNEECHEYEECDTLRIFTERGKPILNAEYAPSLAAANTLALTVCPRARSAQIRTLILHTDLDDRFRVTCF
ncbi:MAG: endo alpha-1,4 polygalactosaminidase [Longimicrobiales bacterium]